MPQKTPRKIKSRNLLIVEGVALRGVAQDN